jgi:molybdate transport system substrate-binding protein
MTAFAPLHAGEISIAAAADLTWCLEDLNNAFQKQHPDASLKTSTGSSGNFFTQISNGAPFDVFLSADMSYPKDLVKAGLADESSLTKYAVGQIVLWTAGDKLDVSKGLEILRDPVAVGKLAIANPEHAPYGRAAKAALEHFDLWKAVEGRIVMGENISQTAQFVQSGNADAGIVALSLVLSPKMAGVGKWVLIPPESYPPLEQAAVLTKAGSANPLANAYLEFLRSDEARKIFDHYGFKLSK